MPRIPAPCPLPFGKDRRVLCGVTHEPEQHHYRKRPRATPNVFLTFHKVADQRVVVVAEAMRRQRRCASSVRPTTYRRHCPSPVVGTRARRRAYGRKASGGGVLAGAPHRRCARLFRAQGRNPRPCSGRDSARDAHSRQCRRPTGTLRFLHRCTRQPGARGGGDHIHRRRSGPCPSHLRHCCRARRGALRGLRKTFATPFRGLCLPPRRAVACGRRSYPVLWRRRPMRDALMRPAALLSASSTARRTRAGSSG